MPLATLIALSTKDLTFHETMLVAENDLAPVTQSLGRSALRRRATFGDRRARRAGVAASLLGFIHTRFIALHQVRPRADEVTCRTRDLHTRPA